MAKAKKPVISIDPTLSREALLQRHLDHGAKGRSHYQQADAFLDALVRRTKQERLPRKITHPVSGEVFVLVDRFQGKNVAFNPVGARRYVVQKEKVKRKKRATEAEPAGTR